MPTVSTNRCPMPKLHTAATPNAPGDTTLWTVQECARYLQRSPRWVYGAVRQPADVSGSIPHTKLPGGAVRFIPDHIHAWVADGCPPAEVFKAWRKK